MKSLLLFLLLAAAARAETWRGTAEITFSGTSTLHDWSGRVAAEPFKTDVTMSNGKPLRVQAEVRVKAANMDTDEPKRDANMFKALKAAEHPFIIGRIDAKFSEVAAADTPAKLPIELTLLGKAQNITGTIKNWQLKGNTATFDLEFSVSMKTSGISVPTVLLFIKVGDGIKVRASVTLTKN